MRTYAELIDQTFDFPTEELKVGKAGLEFQNVDLMGIIKEHGTPLKLTYLPKISQNIEKARKLFHEAITKHNYSGNYKYAYCTKSSHFAFVLDEVIKNKCAIETSSCYDIPIVQKLLETGKISKDHLIICNGFKRPLYRKYISDLINDGVNCIPILDTPTEIDTYLEQISGPINVGLRIATEEEPNLPYYTSRLGIRRDDLLDFYFDRIQPLERVSLKILHFFINSGIRDDIHYWSELNRIVKVYCLLKAECPTLDTLDIGGGFPIKSSLPFEYDYAYMVDQIVANIKSICDEHGVEAPHLMTEFGTYTVGESGAVIYSVMDVKKQNEKESWYVIDGSFITHLPDAWAQNHKYILLPINNWEKDYQRVNLGGLTCDSMDFYNSDAHTEELFLPTVEQGEKQYLGFFHTGAYQESLGGYGGIQHCLVPSPKHLVMDYDEYGKLRTMVFREEQGHRSMLQILGY